MCWSRLKRLLKKKGEKETPKPRIVPIAEKSSSIPSVPASRIVLNMPRRQPCPFGHGWKRRAYKTLGGAYYWCNICPAAFFVGAA